MFNFVQRFSKQLSTVTRWSSTFVLWLTKIVSKQLQNMITKWCPGAATSNER